jgi:hypothetical protein
MTLPRVGILVVEIGREVRMKKIENFTLVSII